jgi:hypothetical protein
MTPEQMKELADRLDHFALGSGDIGKAADLIRQMAAPPAPQPARVLMTDDEMRSVVNVCDTYMEAGRAVEQWHEIRSEE